MVSTLKMLTNDLKRINSYNSKNSGIVKNYPHIFVIETTSHCNLDCVMCPRNHMKRKIEHMKFDIFKKIIDQSKDFIYEVGLDLFGEPLLCPDLFKMIKYAKNAGINNIAMSTNATLLTEENSENILQSGLDMLVIDLDGFTKETYEKIRKGADYDKVVKNIIKFGEIKKRYEKDNKKVPYVYLQIIKMKDTEKEIPDWINFWKDYPFHLCVKSFNTWAQQDDDVTDLAKGDQKVKFNVKRYPCAWLWEQMIFCANGDTVPCCGDFDAKLNMGNIKEQTVLEIWNGDKYKKLREMHKKGHFPSICKNCLEWKGHKKLEFWKDMKFIRNTNLWKKYMKNKKQFDI